MGASSSDQEARVDALTVLTVITPARYSGAERMAVYLADGLQERGHRVVFACKHNELMLAELAARDIEAYPLPIAGKLNVMSPFLLAWLAERVGAQVIHTHLSTAALWGSVAGRLAGIPTVASVHALNRKDCYLYADVIATCSEGVRDHLVGQSVELGRLRVLRNGVDPGQFEGLTPADEMRAELGIAPDAPVIGEVAHLSPKKGQQHLLAATAILAERWPDIVCLLVGEGDDRARLEEQAAVLGVAGNVRLLGYRHDAPRVMQAMDAVVLASVAMEGFGVCLVEAGLLRKPVVGSDAPGIREVIADGETGFLAAVGDARDLADKLTRLLEDRELARAMGERGRDRALEKFTLATMAATAEAIYREAISSTDTERLI